MHATTSTLLAANWLLVNTDGAVCFSHGDFLYYVNAYKGQEQLLSFDRKRNFQFAQMEQQVEIAKYLFCHVKVENEIYFFGGRSSKSHDFVDPVFCKLDLTTWQMTSADNCVVPKRCGSAMVLRNHSLVLFGGFGEGHLSDVWTCDLQSNEKQWKIVEQANTIYARYAHAMVYWKQRDSLLVFGGIVESDLESDKSVQEFSFASRKWTKYDITRAYYANRCDRI